jgi:hypothetical protein
MSELSPTRRRNVARVLSASALNDVADHADIEFGAAGIGGAIRDVAKSLLAPMGHTTRQAHAVPPSEFLAIVNRVAPINTLTRTNRVVDGVFYPIPSQEEI